MSLGSAPEEKLLEQIRYLRQLGIPFDSSELGVGRGHRLRYGFDHLVETYLALVGLRRGVRPKNIAGFLVGDRKTLRRYYRQTYLEAPEGALEAEWVKSRGRAVPRLEPERWLRLHDRYAERGKIEFLRSDEVTDPRDMMSMVERYPGEAARLLVPLTRLVLEVVAWAKEAPETRPGPQ